MTRLPLDPGPFSDAAVAADTRMINDAIVRRMATIPDRWALPLPQIRALRQEGKSIFPLPPESPRASALAIPGPRGPIPARLYLPDGAPRGVYLHFHGGGWTLGAAREAEGLNDRGAARCGLAVVSVDYALAPEDPYPAGPDDCEAAALWLAREGAVRFGTDRFLIGGESAGAHLAVVTLMRLRDRHGLVPFRAANLMAGCYDLRLTPSVRRWGELPLVLNTNDIARFVAHFAPAGVSLDDPDVSPLLGDLSGLPPALVSVGTGDPLLDDSLFMAQAWVRAGSPAELRVYAGGCHVFVAFPGTLADAALARCEAFLREA